MPRIGRPRTLAGACTITVTLETRHMQKLNLLAKDGFSKSQVIRDALDSYLGR